MTVTRAQGTMGASGHCRAQKDSDQKPPREVTAEYFPNAAKA